MRREKKEKWKKIDPQLKQAIRQYRKRFKSEAPFWQTTRKKDYNEPTISIKKGYNSPTLQFKEYKWKRIIASIILPVIMFVGIGMTIGAFKSKVIIEGNTEYMYTPFDKGIGLLKIVSVVGEDFKTTINEGITENKTEEDEKWYNNLRATQSILYGDKYQGKNYTLQKDEYYGIKRFGNLIWFMIKEPIKLTWNIMNYLINDTMIENNN